MNYLKSFQFCTEEREIYPYNVMTPKQIGELTLSPITIFYGNNGSGKSTALNIMAKAIHMPNMTIGNSNEYFKGYVGKCAFLKGAEIPEASRFIRSEDIMDGINRTRKDTARINKIVSETETDMDEFGHPELMAKLFDPDSLTNDDRFFLSRLESARGCFEALFQRPDQFSNGETAMDFFNNELLGDSLYFLDEPENSLAPKFQMELARRIEMTAHYLNSQYVIATHSPFLLSMRGATIIDLDSRPSGEKHWYELPNMKIWYELFKKNSKYFEKEG